MSGNKCPTWQVEWLFTCYAWIRTRYGRQKRTINSMVFQVYATFINHISSIGLADNSISNLWPGVFNECQIWKQWSQGSNKISYALTKVRTICTACGITLYYWRMHLAWLHSGSAVSITLILSDDCNEASVIIFSPLSAHWV